MKFSIVFLGYFMLCKCLIYSQQTNTTKMHHLQQKASELYETFKYDSAAHYYFQVAEIYEKQKNRIKSVKNYRLTANAFNKSIKPDTALYFAQKALEITDSYFTKNTINEVFEKADVNITLGDIHVKLGKYNKGLQFYENALNLVLQADSPGKIKIAKIWNRIGDAYGYQLQFEIAIEFCEKSLKVLKLLQGNNHIDIAKPLITLGEIYYIKKDCDKALEYYQKALEIRIQTFGESHPDVAKTYNKIGSLYKYTEEYDKALEYLSKSLFINIQLFGEQNSSVGTKYNDIGGVYLRKGNYEMAHSYYKKSLHTNIKTLGDSHPNLISIYRNLGYVYCFMGDYDKAIEYHQNAKKLSVLIYGENHLEMEASYINIGRIYDYKENYDKAIEYYIKALKIRINTTGEQHIFAVKTYNMLGKTYSHKGNHTKALEYYQKASEIIKQIFGDHHPFLATDYLLMAGVFDDKNDFKQSIKYYQKALIANLVDFNDTNIYHNPEHFKALSKPVLLTTLQEKAKSLHSLYTITGISAQDISASILTYELIFNLIHEMQNNYSHESTKLLITEENKEYFPNAIHSVLELNKIDPSIKNKEKVFEFIEKTKSTTLSAYLNDLELKQYSNIADSLLQEEKKIAITRNEYETKIQKFKAQKDGYDTLSVRNYQDSLFNYSRRYDKLMNTLEYNYPKYFSLKYKQETAQVKEIQNKINNNTALINYFIGDTSLFICAITKEEYTIKAIKTDNLFNEKIFNYYIDIKSDFTEKELKSSSYFYNYLIEPVKEELKNKDKLIIIPDGNLYYIPFETLCKNDTYTDNLSTIDYLIKDYSITYHNTATLWLSSKENEQNQFASQDNFIGFAPVFDKKNNNGFIVSNEWIQDTTNTESASRSISNDFTHFNTLPYSENEVESIVKLFNKKRKDAKGFFYKEANEENFKHNIQNYKYIHIASHSFTNDLYPNLSGIAFSQPDTSAVYNEDGILYAGETYNLNLPKADLITLSSCKSGLGKLIQGEGFLSLSRGFLYSGTPNIIFSLWNVKDEPTKNLMIDFYKHVLQGADYTSALREAKLNLISNPKTASPKYWGAWILVGR